MKPSECPIAAELASLEAAADAIVACNHQTFLILSQFCPVVEFPHTLGLDRAPLTKHGLIGEDGMISARGREVLAWLRQTERI